MNRGIVQLQIWQFALVYLLLVVIALVMRKARVNLLKQLMVSSVRMSVQLVLAGLVLTWLFENPHPLLVLAYLGLIIGFSIFRVLKQNKGLNQRFQLIIAGAILVSGAAVLCFFILAVVGESLLNPQYAIPIAGMLLGNTMTGVGLGIRSFRNSLGDQQGRVNALLNIGAKPRDILLPFVRQAMETALLPTLNSMLGMGIVSLPGMMTGQILSGTLPMTAILYQIAIMISILTVVCLASFGALYFGFQTLWNSRNQIVLLEGREKV